MSSAGNPTSDPNAAGGSNKQFFCYQCNRTVNVTVFPSSDVSCPFCNGGFIEEYENPNSPYPNLQNLFGSARPASGNPQGFDPFNFMHNYLDNLRSSGAHVQDGQGSSGENRTLGRSFSISLSWPSGRGGSGSGTDSGTGAGSETRYEDLD